MTTGFVYRKNWLEFIESAYQLYGYYFKCQILISDTLIVLIAQSDHERAGFELSNN